MSRFGSQFKQRKPKMKRIQNISLSLTSLQSECGGHQGTPRTLLLALLLLLALTSCQKRPQPTTPDDQKTLIGFSPVSQSAAVKSEPLSSFGTAYQKFGVWGIARSTGQQDYILWENNALSEVNAVLDENDEPTGAYAPASDAYWLSGFKYNFIAIAPYNDPALTLKDITSSTPYSISFSYDMGQKYTESNYDFDLLAAVAEEFVEKSSTHASQQTLIFWHLLSKIKINVIFSGVTSGTVTGMRLENIDTDVQYTISFDDENDNDKPLHVVPEAGESTNLMISFGGMADGGNIIHIVPQAIKDFRLYLDFKITKDGKTAETINYEVNLEGAKNASPFYGNNESYNWNITISPNLITFDVKVVPWQNGEEFEYPIK